MASFTLSLEIIRTKTVRCQHLHLPTPRRTWRGSLLVCQAHWPRAKPLAVGCLQRSRLQRVRRVDRRLFHRAIVSTGHIVLTVHPFDGVELARQNVRASQPFVARQRDFAHRASLLGRLLVVAAALLMCMVVHQRGKAVRLCDTAQHLERRLNSGKLVRIAVRSIGMRRNHALAMCGLNARPCMIYFRVKSKYSKASPYVHGDWNRGDDPMAQTVELAGSNLGTLLGCTLLKGQERHSAVD